MTFLAQENDGTARASDGSTKLASTAVLVVGVVRNCAAQVRSDVLRLKAALTPFRNVHWLLVESDSDDDSTTRLAELADEVDHFRFLSLGSLRSQMPLRTERIAHCRNAYLNEIRTNAAYKQIDFVIIADFDGVNRLITDEAVLTCWERNDWDVCTANQRGPYYDVWALRHRDWSPNDCWSQYAFLQRNVGKRLALFAAVYSRMITISEDSDWIEVESAFGGFAIYRRHALEEAAYVGLQDDGRAVCEHVTFHSQLRARHCRIFINPKLINAAYTEHSERILFLRIKARVDGVVKSLRSWLRPIRNAFPRAR